MDLNKEKPSSDMIDKLYRVQINTIRPFALMMAPVYLYLKANQKFITVKAPLDFFTPEELSRLKFYKYFYYPEFASSLLPFREAGRQARLILTTRVEIPDSAEEPSSSEDLLPLAEFEISDHILKTIGPLWSQDSKNGQGIDPYFVIVFVNELCDLFSKDKLIDARERGVINFDYALFRSSWAIFLALHLGYCNIEFLNRLRNRIFDACIAGESEHEVRNEVDELVFVAHSTLKGNYNKKVNIDFFKKRLGRLSQKLEDRLDRIRLELLPKNRGFLGG